MTLATGGALSLGVDLGWMQFVIGVFCCCSACAGWRAVARHAGLKATHDEAEEFAATRAQVPGATGGPGGRSRSRAFCWKAWKSGSSSWPSASTTPGPAPARGAAIAALIAVILAGAMIQAPLARVPENAIKFMVGAMIVSFGTFWTLEAIGGPAVWPGGDWSLLGLVIFYACGGVALAMLLRRPMALDTIVESGSAR